MYLQLLKNDLKTNPLNNFILLMFMTLSIAISISVFLMLGQLFSSISDMYESAKPPHFLQMHKGEIEQEKIDAFNETYEGMEYWQTVSMIDVAGEDLVVTKGEASEKEAINTKGDASEVISADSKDKEEFILADCRLDISLVKQNAAYDVLLDENREKFEVAEGEIGAPVILLSKYSISVGDEITLRSGEGEKQFKVAGFVYDGQMNSTLCSSTRFLISDKDFDELFGKTGETEYLIEAFFKDKAMAGAYQSAYEESDLPKNGQAVTYTMIFLLSAMTDIMTAMVFLMTGVLMIAIALLCLKYTILAAMEQDVREIGTMKAMGIPADGIRGLYLWKIRGLMLLGCVFGIALSYIMVSFMTNHISATFGKQKMNPKSFFVAVLICMAVYGLIIFFTKHVLRKIRKATVVDMLVTEKGFGKKRKIGGGYGMIVSLMLIVSFIVMLPYQIVNTMEDDKFITYMGSAECDVLLEVEQGEGLEERKAVAEKLLVEQNNIEKCEMTKRVRVQSVGSEEELVSVHIDSGKAAGEGLQYLKGDAPKQKNEIAVSTLVAEQLGRENGEEVPLIWNGKEQKFVISGIYQDVTSGGKTAKVVYDFEGADIEQYTFYVDFEDESNLLDGSRKESNISDIETEMLRTELGKGYSIENMEEFIAQTLGGVSAEVKQARNAAVFIGVLLITLIVMLYMKLRIAQEGKMFAEKKAIGIPFSSICMQELKPMIAAGGIGIVTGNILCNVFGDDMASVLISSMGLGIEKLEFARLPIILMTGLPALLIIVLIVVTLVAIQSVKKLKIMDYINE